MIQASDLRIGNFVQLIPQNKTYRVKITTLRRISDGKHFVSPIELNEMWLINFGFKKEDKKETPFHSNFYSMCLFDYKYSFAYADFRNDWGFYHSYTDALNDSDNNKFDFISCGIKYVHQLQNLFHSLTGKELNYNIYGMPLKVYPDVI